MAKLLLKARQSDRSLNMYMTSHGLYIEHGKMSGFHRFSQMAAIAKHGGKTCAAGAPEQISSISSS